MLAGPTPVHESCIGACSTCPYGGARCGSRGNPKASIVFVGEAPGVQELTNKVPLVGPSGDVFWKTVAPLVHKYGLDPNDILILNALQCRPPTSKDSQKNMAAVERGARACQFRLMGQVMEHPRKLVVAMGNHALRSLTGRWDYKITQVRGQLLPFPGAVSGLLPVLHPAALLRGTGNYRQFREDMRYAFSLLNGDKPKTPITPRWYVAKDAEEVRHISALLRSKPVVACDTETGGFNHLTDEMLALGLCADPHMVYIIPGELVKYTSELFADPGVKFIWHNGKFDMRFMRRDVGDFVRVDEDTMLLSYAQDEQGGIHDLESVGSDLIGAPDYKHMLKPYLPNRRTSYRVIPRPVLYHYLALDTSNTRQIWTPLRRTIAEDPRLETLYTRVLLVASEFLYRIEERGIMLCKNRVEDRRRKLQKEIDIARAKLNEQAARYGYVGDLNPNSPKQLQVLLWDLIKLQNPVRKGDRSTRKEVLEKLVHPVVKALKDYRKASKALSTYVTSLDKNVNIDGAVHATYLIHGTRTGRLSSRGPNMQNVPRGPLIRGMYMARPGYVFIKVDLNQAELRSLACLSGDEYLLEVYRSNTRSLHKETAADFFPGWRERKDTFQGKEELMRAKAVNFGVVYGRTAQSIAEEFGITVEEAQRWIDRWFARSPKAKAFIERCRTCATKGQTIYTLFGRKKRHWIVTRENLQALQNEASNFPHQAIASDICLLGGAKAAPILREHNIFPVNIVHDEVMFECPDVPEIIAWAKNVIIRCLESVPVEWGLTAVPFKAEADVGRRWNIYRAGPEHSYEYSGDQESWRSPDEEVLSALDTWRKNHPLLAAKPGAIPAKQEQEIYDGRDFTDSDEEDTDWTTDDGATPWGHAPSTEPDREIERV